MKKEIDNIRGMLLYTPDNYFDVLFYAPNSPELLDKIKLKCKYPCISLKESTVKSRVYHVLDKNDGYLHMVFGAFDDLKRTGYSSFLSFDCSVGQVGFVIGQR